MHLGSIEIVQNLAAHDHRMADVINPVLPSGFSPSGTVLKVQDGDVAFSPHNHSTVEVGGESLQLPQY